MFLAIDIGNSNIVFGIYDGGQWLKTFRVPTASADILLPEEWTTTYKPHIHRAALSSVVPSVTDKVLSFLKKENLTPYRITSESYEGLAIDIPNKKEIGTDLVANAVAAHDRFPMDNKIIVDFGTALTFTALSSAGQILGVAIAPGLKTAMYALFENAEQLPEVPLVMPKSALGKNTIHALQSGVLLGYVGLVEGMLKRMKSEIDGNCRVLATGGLAFVMKPLHSVFEVLDEHLTLEGIRLIAEKTKK